MFKKPILNEMSGEQRQVFENIKNGYNVIVDACAGSGKSTTTQAELLWEV